MSQPIVNFASAPSFIGSAPMNVEIIWGNKLGDEYRSVVHGLSHFVVLSSRFMLRCEVLMSSSGWFNVVGNNVISEEECLCLYFGNWSFLSPMLLFRLRRDNGDVEIYFSPPEVDGRGKEWELWFVGSICDPEFDLDNIVRRFDRKLLRWRFWGFDVCFLLVMVVLYLVCGGWCFVMDVDSFSYWVFVLMAFLMGGTLVRLSGLRRLWYG